MSHSFFKTHLTGETLRGTSQFIANFGKIPFPGIHMTSCIETLILKENMSYYTIQRGQTKNYKTTQHISTFHFT